VIWQTAMMLFMVIESKIQLGVYAKSKHKSIHFGGCILHKQGLNSHQPSLGCTAMNGSTFLTLATPLPAGHKSSTISTSKGTIHGWRTVANLLGMGCHNCWDIDRELKFEILSHVWIICHTVGPEHAWFSDLCRVPFHTQKKSKNIL
jgi:hypothetical protein